MPFSPLNRWTIPNQKGSLQPIRLNKRLTRVVRSLGLTQKTIKPNPSVTILLRQGGPGMPQYNILFLYQTTQRLQLKRAGMRSLHGRVSSKNISDNINRKRPVQNTGPIDCYQICELLSV